MSSDEAMTGSEEQIRLSTERQEAGRARLRKHVVTEEQQQTIPACHEEARVEREPVTEAIWDAAVAGPDIPEAEHEVALHVKRPVVETKTGPVERVRLTADERTDEDTVKGKVRKEQMEADAPDEDEDALRADAQLGSCCHQHPWRKSVAPSGIVHAGFG